MAFSPPRDWSQQEWSADFSSLLQSPADPKASQTREVPDKEDHQPRFSLVDGSLHDHPTDLDDSAMSQLSIANDAHGGDQSQQLAVRPEARLVSQAAPGELAEVR